MNIEEMMEMMDFEGLFKEFEKFVSLTDSFEENDDDIEEKNKSPLKLDNGQFVINW